MSTRACSASPILAVVSAAAVAMAVGASIAVITAVAMAGCGVSSPVSRELGARCDVQSDCDDRCLRDDAGYPDGFCTRSCDDGDGCPGGTVCADREGGVCLVACRDADACAFLGPGWTCAASPTLPDGEITVCVGQ